MQWKCPNNDEVTFNYPVDDPPGKIWCDGCGQMHRLIPGKMSAKDQQAIDDITAAAQHDPEMYDLIEMRAEVIAKQHLPLPKPVGMYGNGKPPASE